MHTRLHPHLPYTIGWLCALGVELAAAQAVLDEQHPDLLLAEHDSNAYVLGRIGQHNVVIATLPIGRPGTSPAAVAATNLLRSFPNIRFGFLVEVGGGAVGQTQSDPRNDIRLGDVVVSSALIQYDYGKLLHDGKFIQTGSLNGIPTSVGTALAKLRANARLRGYEFPAVVDDLGQTYSDAGFDRPDKDQLFKTSYTHNKSAADDCSMCDLDQTVSRQMRERPNIPHVHYGTIGSANQVLRDPVTRNKLREEENILCVEIEAAGLMHDFPCVVVRGICDYCDSHKNKDWQPCAAAVAAAYSKELIQTVTPASLADQRPAIDIMNTTKEVLELTKTV